MVTFVWRLQLNSFPFSPFFNNSFYSFVEIEKIKFQAESSCLVVDALATLTAWSMVQIQHLKLTQRKVLTLELVVKSFCCPHQPTSNRDAVFIQLASQSVIRNGCTNPKKYFSYFCQDELATEILP